MAKEKTKPGKTAKQARLPAGPAPPRERKPVKETIVVHTTTEKQRNAPAAATDGGALTSPKSNRLLLAGGALAGGAASVVVAEKAGLSPVWAGVATSGGALAASGFVENPSVKEALYAASLGSAGLVGTRSRTT